MIKFAADDLFYWVRIYRIVKQLLYTMNNDEAWLMVWLASVDQTNVSSSIINNSNYYCKLKVD